MNQRTQLEAQTRRWAEAGLIDAEARDRILAFEATQEQRANLRWPVLFAMVFGGILLAAGVTLFVAAHWIELSPAMRFSLLLLMTALLHIGGAALADRFPPLSTTLHALGTATLGAAIFLTAQIFNLHEDWATGVLLWAIGAAVGYILLRDWVQAAFLALLAPGWLISQWTITTAPYSDGNRPLALGLILTALCYLSARIADQESTARRTLVWIGGIALLPCVGIAMAIATREGYAYDYRGRSPVPFATLLIGWTVALAAPLVFSWLLRGRAVWINFLWAAWAYAVILSAGYSHSYESNVYQSRLATTLALYALCALGSAGLLAWGLYEKRKERINLGIAGLVVTHFGSGVLGAGVMITLFDLD